MRWTLPILGVLTLVGVSHALAGTDGRSGTSKVYAVTVDQIIPAITNAFESDRYHDMLFVPSHEQWDQAAHRWSRRPATNEWGLNTGHLPVAVIARGQKTVPYYAHFEITASPLGTNSCKVSVVTISATIPDGKEIGIHGGWAVHMKHIPPVFEEETNVLLRIEKQLLAMQAGDRKPLPATPDTKDAAEYPMRQLMEFNPEAKTNLLPVIRAMTNAVPPAQRVPRGVDSAGQAR